MPPKPETFEVPPVQAVDPATPLFGSWCPMESRLPAMMDSVIVWGTLEGEAEPDSHEGFLSYGPATAPRWRSVRAEEDGGLNRRILDVTHWMPRPRGPNTKNKP
jgi:hypothetical protein